MKRARKLISLLVVLLMLSGCWDRIELNDVSIVTGLAVDKGTERKFKLTVELINASQFSSKNSGGGQSAPVTTFSLEGDTVAEMLQQMNFGVARRLIFSHTRVLYISEEIAREGILDFIDFLDRSGEFRNDFNIVVTRGSEARKFTTISYPVQKVPSLKLHKQAQSLVEEWGGDPNVRLTDFISALTSTGRAPVAASVSIQGDADKGESLENIQKLHVDALVVMRGLAVFNNKKLLGFLSRDDTRSYYWLDGLENTSLSVPCLSKDSQKFNGIHVLLTKSKMKIDLRNGKPTLKVDITGETRLEATQCTDDLTLTDTYQKYEEQTNAFVSKQIKATIEKVQTEFGVDIFGFGEVYNRQHHKQFKKVEKKWNEEFSQAPVEVKVDLHMRRSGIRGKGYLKEVPEGG